MISENSIDKLIKQICKNLSSTDLKCRNKGFKRLKTLFSCDPNGAFNLTFDHFLLLWKGLHYWLWSQDKLVNQEALISNICQLLPKISNIDIKLQWIKAFFATEIREWKMLDKWRIDKFMMLVRRFFRQVLSDMAEDSWQTAQSLVDILKLYPISDDRTDGAFGLRLHFSDIYLEELSKFELQNDNWMIFLRPYFNLVPSLPRDHPLLKRIEDIFYLILPPTEEEEEDPLNIDMKKLANFCFYLAGHGGKNAKKIYEWAAICFSIVGEEPPACPAEPTEPAESAGPLPAGDGATAAPLATTTSVPDLVATPPEPARAPKRKRKSAQPKGAALPASSLQNGSPKAKSPPRKRRKMQVTNGAAGSPGDIEVESLSNSASPVPTSPLPTPSPSPKRKAKKNGATSFVTPSPKSSADKRNKRVSFGKIYRKPFKKRDAVKTPSPGTITSREAGKGILKKDLLRRAKKLNLNVR